MRAIDPHIRYRATRPFLKVDRRHRTLLKSVGFTISDAVLLSGQNIITIIITQLCYIEWRDYYNIYGVTYN